MLYVVNLLVAYILKRKKIVRLLHCSVFLSVASLIFLEAAVTVMFICDDLINILKFIIKP